MGYSKSKEVVERVRPLLDVALMGKNKFEVPSKDPTRLAHALHQALSLVKDLNTDDDDSKYKEVRDRYKIRVRGGKVIFDPRTVLDFENPILELAQTINEVSIPEVRTVMQVVGACIKHKAPLMVFPDAALVPVELSQLRRWADNNNYEVSNEGTLTLKKNVRDSITEVSATQYG